MAALMDRVLGWLQEELDEAEEWNNSPQRLQDDQVRRRRRQLVYQEDSSEDDEFLAQVEACTTIAACRRGQQSRRTVNAARGEFGSKHAELVDRPSEESAAAGFTAWVPDGLGSLKALNPFAAAGVSPTGHADERAELSSAGRFDGLLDDAGCSLAKKLPYDCQGRQP